MEERTVIEPMPHRFMQVHDTLGFASLLLGVCRKSYTNWVLLHRAVVLVAALFYFRSWICFQSNVHYVRLRLSLVKHIYDLT